MQIVDSEEVWKDIVGFDAPYKISSHGRIMSFHNKHSEGCIMKFNINASGYKRTTLYSRNDGKIARYAFLIHRLMAMTFLPNPENKETVNHIDGNKLNNRLNNLEWATRKENNTHAYKLGLNKGCYGEKNGWSKLTESQVVLIRKRHAEGVRTQIIADEFSITLSYVNKIVNFKSWKYVNQAA